MDMDNDYEDNRNIEPDPIEEDFEDDFDADQEDDGDDFPESLEWEAIEGEQGDSYGDDRDGFDFPEFDG